MGNLEDKDKTIAILRHQYRREAKENSALKEEIAILEFEIEKLREIYSLTDKDAYLKLLYGDEIVTDSRIS